MIGCKLDPINYPSSKPMAQYDLIERVCKCGCGGRWRALASSKSEYCSAWHDPKYIPVQRFDIKVAKWLKAKFGEMVTMVQDDDVDGLV